MTARRALHSRRKATLPAKITKKALRARSEGMACGVCNVVYLVRHRRKRGM